MFAYDDGEVRQEFSICFRARIDSGTLAASDESYEVAFIDPEDLDGLVMEDSIRLRINDSLSRQRQRSADPDTGRGHQLLGPAAARSNSAAPALIDRATTCSGPYRVRDLRTPFLERHPGPVRARRQIAVGQCPVQSESANGNSFAKSSMPRRRLPPRTRVVRHQPRHLLVPQLAYEPPTVERMESCHRQLRRVADVMQQRRRHQQVAVVRPARERPDARGPLLGRRVPTVGPEAAAIPERGSRRRLEGLQFTRSNLASLPPTRYLCGMSETYCFPPR